MKLRWSTNDERELAQRMYDTLAPVVEGYPPGEVWHALIMLVCGLADQTSNPQAAAANFCTSLRANFPDSHDVAH